MCGVECMRRVFGNMASFCFASVPPASPPPRELAAFPAEGAARIVQAEYSATRIEERLRRSTSSASLEGNDDDDGGSGVGSEPVPGDTTVLHIDEIADLLLHLTGRTWTGAEVRILLERLDIAAADPTGAILFDSFFLASFRSAQSEDWAMAPRELRGKLDFPTFERSAKRLGHGPAARELFRQFDVERVGMACMEETLALDVARARMLSATAKSFLLACIYTDKSDDGAQLLAPAHLSAHETRLPASERYAGHGVSPSGTGETVIRIKDGALRKATRRHTSRAARTSLAAEQSQGRSGDSSGRSSPTSPRDGWSKIPFPRVNITGFGFAHNGMSVTAFQPPPVKARYLEPTMSSKLSLLPSSPSGPSRPSEAKLARPSSAAAAEASVRLDARRQRALPDYGSRYLPDATRASSTKDGPLNRSRPKQVAVPATLTSPTGVPRSGLQMSPHRRSMTTQMRPRTAGAAWSSTPATVHSLGELNRAYGFSGSRWTSKGSPSPPANNDRGSSSPWVDRSETNAFIAGLTVRGYPI